MSSMLAFNRIGIPLPRIQPCWLRIGTAAKNLPEGTVELEIMGEPDEIDAFIQEIAEESTMAHNIKGFRTQDIHPLDGIKGFTIAK